MEFLSIIWPDFIVPCFSNPFLRERRKARPLPKSCLRDRLCRRTCVRRGTASLRLAGGSQKQSTQGSILWTVLTSAAPHSLSPIVARTARRVYHANGGNYFRRPPAASNRRATLGPCVLGFHQGGRHKPHSSVPKEGRPHLQ